MASAPAGPPTGPPASAGQSSAGGMPQVFGYQPSFDMALIGAIFFTITMMIHSVQLIRSRSWYFVVIPQVALCKDLVILLCLSLGSLTQSSRCNLVDSTSNLCYKSSGLSCVHCFYFHTKVSQIDRSWFDYSWKLTPARPLSPVTSIGIIFTFTRLVWWITPSRRRSWSNAWAPPGFISVFWAGIGLLCDAVKVCQLTTNDHPPVLTVTS
jgi:hypothetical protein